MGMQSEIMSSAYAPSKSKEELNGAHCDIWRPYRDRPALWKEMQCRSGADICRLENLGNECHSRRYNGNKYFVLKCSLA